MLRDVKSYYYASIDHQMLDQQLQKYVAVERVLALLGSYLRRTVCEGGEYQPQARGISLGCSLSPLPGALYLLPLDEQMAQLTYGW